MNKPNPIQTRIDARTVIRKALVEALISTENDVALGITNALTNAGFKLIRREPEPANPQLITDLKGAN